MDGPAAGATRVVASAQRGLHRLARWRFDEARRRATANVLRIWWKLRREPARPADAAAQWTDGQPDVVKRFAPLGSGLSVPSLRQLMRGLLLFFAVFVLAFAAVALTRADGRTAAVWLANAVVVAALLRAPRGEAPALLALGFGAILLANALEGDPLNIAAALAGANMIESAVVAGLMKRHFGADTRFDDGKVIWAFLLSAGLIGPAVSATIVAAVLASVYGSAFVAALLHWFLAHSLGLLTLGALLIAAPDTLRSGWRGAWGATAIAVLVAAGVTASAFGQGAAPLLFTVAPVLMIATLRAPLSGALAALAASVVIGIGFTLAGVGPIAEAPFDSAGRSYLLQGFIAALLCAVLPIRALMGERERLGGVLARSERLFSRIAEASASGTIHFDPSGTPTYVNLRWTALTGIEQSAVGDDGWLDAIEPADRGAARSLWARAQSSLEPCTGEFRFLNRGKPAGFAELNLFPEVHENQVLGFVARLTDVTDRREAEEALQEHEARIRMITENAQDVILRMGLDGRADYVSGAAPRVTGYAPGELVDRPLAERIHPDDQPVFEASLARIAAGTADSSIEFRLRHRDGHYSWFESSQRPLFDKASQPSGFIASLRDIGSRRQSEAMAAEASAKLRETNRLLLLAEQLAGVGHWRADPVERELDYSPQINRIMGRLRPDRLRLDEALRMVHFADRRRLIACLARARRVAGGGECLIRIHVGTSLRHVRLVAQAETDRGSFAGWVGVVRDMTEEIVAQDALIMARDDAQAAARAKSYFLATMSHEIRTPMTGVLGMIELLRDNPSDAERAQFFATLKQSANLLMAVLDDVLDFSKIDSGTLQLEQSEFDLEALAAATLDLFGNAASRKGLLISFDSRCSGAFVRGDSVRLQQVLSNLLSNAIKFTSRGRITLTLSSEAAEEQRTRYRFEVIDTGIGLEPEQIGTLFDPFVQADVSISRQYGGTGLGLAISRRLVEAMGGELDVRSRPGRGSTFMFDVILAAGSPSEQGHVGDLMEVAHATDLDVLIAEDNPVNQMLIAAIVRRMGHRVTMVENGREAVDTAALKRFDVILMDMQMPELDGLAATRAIRASGGPCASVPIFALTADASAERRRFYDGAGLTDFLTKPIDRKALAARLAMVGPAAKRPAAVEPAAKLAAAVEPTAKRLAAVEPGGAQGEEQALALPPRSESPSPAGDEGAPRPAFDPERVAELRAALGSYRFEGLLGLMANECLERPMRLRAMLARGDLAALRAESHSLKGASISIGAVALGHAALRLEVAADLAAAAPLIAHLEQVARDTRRAAEVLLDRPYGDRASA